MNIRHQLNIYLAMFKDVVLYCLLWGICPAKMEGGIYVGMSGANVRKPDHLHITNMTVRQPRQPHTPSILSSSYATLYILLVCSGEKRSVEKKRHRSYVVCVTHGISGRRHDEFDINETLPYMADNRPGTDRMRRQSVCPYNDQW